MVLAMKLGLHTAQADITAAFVHAQLDYNEHIFVHQPPGFQRGHDVLSLNRSVYDLRQAPRYSFHHLKCHMVPLMVLSTPPFVSAVLILQICPFFKMTGAHLA